MWSKSFLMSKAAQEWVYGNRLEVMSGWKSLLMTLQREKARLGTERIIAIQEPSQWSRLGLVSHDLDQFSVSPGCSLWTNSNMTSQIQMQTMVLGHSQTPIHPGICGLWGFPSRERGIQLEILSQTCYKEHTCLALQFQPVAVWKDC